MFNPKRYKAFFREFDPLTQPEISDFGLRHADQDKTLKPSVQRI